MNLDGATWTVADLLRHASQSQGIKAALFRVDGTVVCDYEGLQARADAITVGLQSAGVRPGDVVMVTVPKAVEMFVAILGAMGAGACAPMNPAYTDPELSDLADELQPAAVIVLEGSGGPTERIARERGVACLSLAAGGVLVGDATERVVGAAPAPDDVALILHTAGTTAKPKQVPLTNANLVAATRNVVASLQLTPEDRCLNVMPLFHSHGLLGVALSTVAAGASIVCADGIDPRHFLQWATTSRSTWYSAAATIHHLVLDAPGEWPGLRFMRSASAPLAPQVAEALEARFGAPMIEVYGMTEAYQIAANPLPPGERRLGSVGLPTGTEIAVADEEGRHLDPGVEGEVIVRGPAVFGGYSAPDDANDEAFFDGWFRTGDLGWLSDDGYLTISGRRKEQINRGGEKIAPREVDEALLAHPDVIGAMAFGYPDPVLGEEVAAALLLRPGRELDVSAVRTFLHGRIAPFKVPRRVVLVDQLPKSSTGKLQRIQFAQQHADELLASGSANGSQMAELDESAGTLERLTAIWQELLETSGPPAAGDHFFDLGGTSLLTMELVTRIDDVFGVDLPVIDVIDVPTLGEMAQRIDVAETSPASLLHRYRSGSSGTHLILVPGQMGMAVGLNLIADAVTADVDIYLFDYPGHRAGERPLNAVEDLAARLVHEINQAGLSGALAFYGNSIGSWVVFEAARQLDELGRRPILVGIGDMFSPFFNTKESPTRPALQERLRNRVRRARRDLGARWNRRAARASQSVAGSRRDAVARASNIARRTYGPHPYEGDLLVLAADQRAPQYGENLGWERHVTGSITCARVHGRHGSMHRDQAMEIGAALSDQLAARVPCEAPSVPLECASETD